MRRVESSAVELHDLIDSSIDRVEAELFTDLGYGYATHPSIGAGELQLYYVSKTGPIATACRTSDFLHLDAVDEPLLVCSEGLVVHRGDVLEGLNYNDLEVGDAEGKPTGYYLRDGNNIYVERRYCDTGSSYVEGAQEDIDSWRPGC